VPHDPAAKTDGGMIMNKVPLLVLIVALLSLGLVAEVKPHDSSSIAQISTTQVVIVEEPESSKPEERMARQAESARYNGGGCDLTIPDRDCAFEGFWPSPFPEIPLKEGALAFVGSVTKMQPYLSQDRTHIYKENTIQIEELFKSPQGFQLPSDRTLIVDQIGGAMRLLSGPVIYDGSRIDFMGQTYVGGRYVFFLLRVHEGRDLGIIKAYELRDGNVFKLTEDGSPGKTLLSRTRNKADSFSDEQEFLHAIRQ
jgi:hypothetical protein